MKQVLVLSTIVLLCAKAFINLPIDINLAIFQKTSSTDVWNFCLTCEEVLKFCRFSQIGQILRSAKGQKAWLEDIVPMITKDHLGVIKILVDSEMFEVDFFRYVHLLTRPHSYEVLSFFSENVIRNRKVCKACRMCLFHDKDNPFIAEILESVPMYQHGHEKRQFWTPSGSRDVLDLEFFSTVVVPATRFGSYIFCPAIIHQYFLPVWRGTKVLNENERKMFEIYGPILSPGFERFFGAMLEDIKFREEPGFLTKLMQLYEVFHLNFSDLQMEVHSEYFDYFDMDQFPVSKIMKIPTVVRFQWDWVITIGDPLHERLLSQHWGIGSGVITNGDPPQFKDVCALFMLYSLSASSYPQLIN